MTVNAVSNETLEKITIRRVTLRLMPFLMVCYFFALLDRVNVGFAALQMNKDLGLSPTAGARRQLVIYPSGSCFATNTSWSWRSYVPVRRRPEPPCRSGSRKFSMDLACR